MPSTFADRVLWTLLAGVTLAAATVLSRRAAEWAWIRAKGTPPPKGFSVVEGFARWAVSPVFERQG